MIQVFDCEQGSADWFAVRAGIPTASEFSTVMAKGKDGGRSLTRDAYLRRLAAEVLTGDPAPEGYTSSAMERGKLLEDEARALYAFMRDVEPERVGFIRNGAKGASPDSLLPNSGLEIKVPLPATLIGWLQKGELPSEHKAQVQGSMWVAERDTWDFMAYCPKLPPLILSIRRDDTYVAQLAKAVDAFNEELDALVASIRTYQNFGAAA